MELRELRYFVQIAKDQSYTKAAEHLYVSQPALSKTMRKLEGELGVRLLGTTSAGVFLTDFGQELYNRALPLLNEFDALPGFIQDVKNAAKAKIRVGATPMLADLFLMDIIVDFCNQYPNVELKLTEAGSKEVRQQLEDGNLDIGVCILGDGFDCLEDTILLEDHMVVCVNENSALADYDYLTFQQLKDEYFNMYSTFSTLNTQLLAHCSNAGFAPKINISSSKIGMILQMTSSGKGICVLPYPYAIQHLPKGMKMIPLKENFPWVACLTRNKVRYSSQITEIFSKFIEDSFSKYENNAPQ